MTHPIDNAIFDVIHAARAADTFEPDQALELTDDLLSNVRRAARDAGELLAQEAIEAERSARPLPKIRMPGGQRSSTPPASTSSASAVAGQHAGRPRRTHSSSWI